MNFVHFCTTHACKQTDAQFSNKLSMKRLIGTLFVSGSTNVTHRDGCTQTIKLQQTNPPMPTHSTFLKYYYTQTHYTCTWTNFKYLQSLSCAASHYNAISSHYVSFVSLSNCQERWGQSAYCSGHCLSNLTAGLSK